METAQPCTRIEPPGRTILYPLERQSTEKRSVFKEFVGTRRTRDGDAGGRRGADASRGVIPSNSAGWFNAGLGDGWDLRFEISEMGSRKGPQGGPYGSVWAMRFGTSNRAGMTWG